MHPVTFGFIMSRSRQPCHYISQSHFCITDNLHVGGMRMQTKSNSTSDNAFMHVQSIALITLWKMALVATCTLMLAWSTRSYPLYTWLTYKMIPPHPDQSACSLWNTPVVKKYRVASTCNGQMRDSLGSAL